MEKPIIVSKSTLSDLSKKAKLSKRKRQNLNFHQHFGDSIQRLLNAIEPDTYITPHKHETPDKREVFILLEGEMALLIFDDHGNIIDSIYLNKNNIQLVEIPPRTWHSLVSLKEGTVYYEIKDGPYNVVTDKNFAPWAPSEDESDSINYLKFLKEFAEKTKMQ